MEVAGHKGQRLDPFTWITDQGFRSQVTNLESLEHVGDDFMRTVFYLGENKYGVAMNEPQTVAYVVHVDDYSYVTSGIPQTEESIRDQFLSMGHSQVDTVAMAEKQRLYENWIKEIQKEAGLRWVRHPVSGE
jgi:hypothetical protein